ncbi:MAG: GNAT family N-acetyltransferase, partial [Oscillospiraceae bacterium]
MIRQAQPEDAALLRRLFARFPFLGGRLATAYECYQNHAQLCGFYLANNTGVLMLQGGNALLCGRADPEELAAFLRFTGVENIKSENTRPPGFAQRPQVRMVYRQAGAPAAGRLPAGVLLEEEPSLWQLAFEDEVLPLPDPGGYYADACLRRTRGHSDIVCAAATGRYVATAGVFRLQPQGAYITAVHSLPEWRGRGIAGALLAHLASRCGGRPVW